MFPTPRRIVPSKVEHFQPTQQFDLCLVLIDHYYLSNLVSIVSKCVWKMSIVNGLCLVERDPLFRRENGVRQ